MLRKLYEYMKFSRITFLSAILLLAASFVSIQKTQAQISDKLIWHTGFMYQITRVADLDINNVPVSVPSPAFYTFNVGAYYAAVQKNDIVSAGIQANAQIGLSPVNAGVGIRLNYLVELPIYAMARVGAGCTPYNEQRVGLSVGVGTNLSHYAYYMGFGNTLVSPRITALNPAGIVELTIVSRGNPTTFRLHGSLNNAPLRVNLRDLNGDITQFGPEIDQVGFIGLGVIYGF